ncbi:UbiA family prenyltransferase [Pontimonas salivibrio]|uniref:UbiA family prenyltransferase n=1 Tax=Pontimonas salivibrio TaxID=1159327 RepID=UPI00131A0BBE|nr:UbiA family prenyltransferase [Pontimonas salivibrio]
MVRTLSAIIRSSHPGPTLAVTTLSLLLALAFNLPAGNAAWIVIAVLLNQVAVGVSNDVVDVARDRRAGRKDKPIAAGEITLATARWAVVIAGTLSLGLSAWVHPIVGLWQAVFLASGLAYNFGLKATVFSALTYATGFGSLPILVSMGAEPAAWPPLWVVVVGASLGVSAHFANVLPDGDTDRLEGVRGLPQRLSRPVAAAVIVVLTVLSSVMLITGGGSGALITTVLAGIIASSIAIWAGLLALWPGSTIWPFRLSMLAALVLALGLVGAISG